MFSTIEISCSKLRHVQGVAVCGGSMEILLMMLVCGVVSDFTGAPSKEGVFVGAFLSMSSTAVVIKCLMERNGMQSLHGQITVGTLILQDCTVGLLFARLPVVGGSHGVGGSGPSSHLHAYVFISWCRDRPSRSLVCRLFRLISLQRRA